jgi:excisionase family DNA binding protein
MGAAEPEKLNVKAAGKVLGVSPYTVRTWIREKRIPFFRCGRRIVLAMADLERFLADNRVEARNR